MSERSHHLRNLFLVEILVQNLLQDRFEDDEHPAICLQRRHVSIEVATFEVREAIKVIHHEVGRADVLDLKAGVPVPACKLRIFPQL